MTKNEILARTLLHKVKQRNEAGAVDNFYMVGVLRAKNYKCSFEFAKIIVKNYWPLFCGHSVVSAASRRKKIIRASTC